MASYNEVELEAYLDEALTSDEMASIEAALRDDETLRSQLAVINRRRDAGVHSLGEIWRRHRVSCPARETLGTYLLGVLDNEYADYIKFHVDQIGCRLCGANLEDLKRQQEEATETASDRRKRYFQSSAGYLRPDE